MPFILTTCAVGAEAVLRRWFQDQCGWHPAFSRPGLITYKIEEGVDASFSRPHPLVRNWGLSLGFCSSSRELRRVLDLLEQPVIQVVAGEAGPKGQVPDTVQQRWDLAAHRVRQEILTIWGERVRLNEPVDGDAVLEVLVRPGEPWVLGWHRHTPERGPLPGGAWDLHPPDDAPSRSWAKLEEMIRWSGIAPGKGDSVLEIGCAPGGATVAMLDRGLKVFSVDPRPVLLPERLQQASFRQHRSLIEYLPRHEFPRVVNWIVVDMGVSAPMAVHALGRIVPRYRGQMKGMFITLKLNEWQLAERIPFLLEKIRSMGFNVVEGACLPTFRQEIGVVAR